MPTATDLRTQGEFIGQLFVKKWSKENGPPERVLIVENGPDGPVVTKDHNIDEKGKVID